MKNLKLASLALSVGGVIGVAIGSYKIAKISHEIDETTREIEKANQIIAANEEFLKAYANNRWEGSEEFEKFLEETGKWLEEMNTEEEES